MSARDLTASASRFGVHISPTDDDGHVLLSEADVRALLQKVRSVDSSVETNRVWTLLNAHHANPSAQTLTGRDATMLGLALERIAQARDRADRISRGQYVGPMSGPEAVKFTMARFGRP